MNEKEQVVQKLIDIVKLNNNEEMSDATIDELSDNFQSPSESLGDDNE